MKVGIYEQLVRAGKTRRDVLKGAASVTVLAATSTGTLGSLTRQASAQDNLRAEILKIPGVGKGSPTDADWQKVGELCLGVTKANVKEGEFAGVELTFMGLNNQNLHNFLFRGFLKPWEAYTGAKINWIDLAQADYNARLQQSIATGTVDFDIIEMGAPFEGDTASKGLLDEMPDWVKSQIEADDLVGYLQPPVGTWDGKTYRITIDGDCHTFAYRKDYLTDAAISGATGMTEAPTTWQQVNEFSKKVKGQKDPLTGLDAYGFLDPLKGWGGFGFYFLEDRATAYAKHPDDKAWLFDSGHHEAARQQSGLRAGDPGRDGPDCRGRLSVGPDQRRSGDHRLPAVPRRHRRGTDMVGRRGVERAHIGHLGRGRCRRLLDQPRLEQGLQLQDQRVGEPGQPELCARTWPISAGVFTSPAASPATRRSARRPGAAAAHLGGKDLSLWTAAYPSGFQPYRNSHFNYAEWEAAGYDRAFIEDYLGSNADSYNHPNAAIEPRIPGIFQYYSVAEDELAKGFAGQYKSAQETADAIAAAWEKITDQIGRESQIKLYKASLGL